MSIFLVSFCKLATQAWCTFFREKKSFYWSPHFPLYGRRKSIFESHSLRKKRGEPSPLPPPFFFIRPPTMVPSFAPRKKRGKLPLPRKFKNGVSFWLSEKRQGKTSFLPNKKTCVCKKHFFLVSMSWLYPKRQTWTNAFKDRYSPATAKKAPMAHPIRGGKEK